MDSKQPVIGIACGVKPGWLNNEPSSLSYAVAIEKAGGKVVWLGAGRHGKLSECDGLFVPGGWDIHPKMYARLPGDEKLTDEQVMAKYRIKTEKSRDGIEIKLTREALAAGMPFFGICRGFQTLNIVVGKYLIPDIITWKPGSLVHFANDKSESESHKIDIEPDSWMERAYGSKSITVNSRHHQGLMPEFVSEKLRITAMAPDGIVEAVEMKDAKFVVGVQWHPEREKDSYINSISGPLFKAFVDASGGYRR